MRAIPDKDTTKNEICPTFSRQKGGMTRQKQIKSTKTGVQETTRPKAYTDRKPGPDKQSGSTGMCFPAPEST